MAVDSASQIAMPESFVKLVTACNVHLGCNQVTKSMKKYVYALRKDNVPIIHLQKMWEKFVLAARAVAGVPDTNTVVTISSKTFGGVPVSRVSEAVSGKKYTERFIPGSFTNRHVKNSCEPCLIIVSDPFFDKQGVKETSGINCPVIAFCGTDADLKFVDIAIPVNNRSSKAIGACFFILDKLVNYIKDGGSLNFFEKDVERFFYRDKQEMQQLEAENNSDEQEINEKTTAYNNEEDFGVKEMEVKVFDDAGEWDK